MYILEGSTRDAVATHVQDRVYSKAAWRILPLLFLLYVVAQIDRVNVGFAKLQMADALQFSDTVYGIGAGIFFIGYFLFEVPSNMLLERVGARRWIARILIFWGPLSAATAFVETPTAFYVLRFLLGVGEAGLFPGIILYLTYWFPARVRAKYLASFMLGMPIAGIVTGPLSGLIMARMDKVYGLGGWQWMFVLEGLPAVLLGLYVLLRLDDGPQDARWLTRDERSHLLQALREDPAVLSHAGAPALSPWQEFKAVARMRWIWTFIAAYFLLIVGATGVAFWLPQFIQDLQKNSVQAVGLFSAIPFVVATISMLLVSAHSDRRGERRLHLVAMFFLSAAGFAASGALSGQPLFALLGLTAATVGFLSAFPLFWALVTSLLAPASAAVCIAFINCIGNLGGAAGPVLVGYIKQNYGLAASLYALGAALLAAALLILVKGRRSD